MTTYGSVCSGIEAAYVAWEPVGFSPAWLSEIEPFPCAVLQHRLPGVPNLGDMCAIDELIESGAVEAPDIFCGGTPCQAFSFAGKRRSLEDKRGALSLVFCEIADAIDRKRKELGLPPTVVFWENVPGVLNTKDNAFGCFLGKLVGADFPLASGAGRWPSAGFASGPSRIAAWRVLDAQYFGVPQRRRRVFVVSSASGGGLDPRKVLFERPGVLRDSAKSAKSGEGVAAFAESSFGTFRETSIGGTLKAQGGFFGGGDETLVAQEHSVFDISHANDVVRESKKVPTLQARMGTDGNQIPLVLSQGQSGAIHVDSRVTPTLRTEVKASSRSTPLVLSENGTDRAVSIDITPPLKTTTPCYCLAENTIGREPKNGGNGLGVSCETSFTLNATGVHGVMTRSSVRRLTPVECERLQGFPDNWTRIPYRGKPEDQCPDSPRYKAIGNSWAVPVVRWIGKRINEEIEK